MAQFRDLLINIGQARDCPELREKIRRLRRNCVEACKASSQHILPQVRRYVTYSCNSFRGVCNATFTSVHFLGVGFASLALPPSVNVIVINSAFIANQRRVTGNINCVVGILIYRLSPEKPFFRPLRSEILG